MPDDPMKDDPQEKVEDSSGVSRRDFLKISTISAAAVPILGTKVVHAAGDPVKVYGPGKVPVEFTINGQKHTLQTGAASHLARRASRSTRYHRRQARLRSRRVRRLHRASRWTRAVYACSVLAIEAQDKPITTVESLMQGDKLHPIQQAFVDNDASQCGFCTPGFVVACKAFLDQASQSHPRGHSPRPQRQSLPLRHL